MHFSPNGAVISWKKQRGLPKSVVDHCHGPCCVGKSFPKPSDWTWEFDRLGSDHRSGCVQWIVVTNRAVNSSRVDRQYRRCQPSVASMWTRDGPSLHNLWKARKSDTNRGHWVHQTKCYGGKRKLSTLAGSPFLFTNEGRLGWETVKPSDWLVAESVSGSTELGQWMK